MESLLKQTAVHDPRRRLRRREVHGSCSVSSSENYDDDEDDDEEEEDVDLLESSSPSPLQDMSSLLLQLPLKRGLSKHYSGKSESFTSLSSVKRVEDLAKLNKNPINKKLKLCNPSSSSSRSHFSSLINGGIENHHHHNNDDDDKPHLFPHSIDQRVA